jgi:isopentenyl diphosphate isomerase/L-lactate dehydrogenase-like FMN-dependent dehydrogenase
MTAGASAFQPGEVGVKINRAVNISDLQKMAKRRLPRIAYDFIEGGVEDELGIARNEASFDRERLVPRYLVDVSTRDQSCDLFDRKYESPFGVSATGLAALFRPGADLMLAAAAAAANIPFMMSGMSTATIEAAAKIAPSHSWYQLYVARDHEITLDLIRRAREAGFGTLVLTVDVPVSSKRERNLRNGFALPPRLNTATILDAMRHPGWIAGYLRHGMPRFENWEAYARANSSTRQINAFAAKQAPASTVTWKDLEEIRQVWPRHLVVKGILHREDAMHAAEIGVDGIIVSNHGGRQLDQAPAPLEVLPEIREAVGEKVTLMVDGGVRRGADIIMALCKGAHFVMVGRATLYGAAAGGVAGVRKAISILQEEIDLVLGQIGCPSVAQLDQSFLMKAP